MTNNMTSQNIDLSSLDTLYINRAVTSMLTCLALRIWYNKYETVTLVMRTGHWCLAASPFT